MKRRFLWWADRHRNPDDDLRLGCVLALVAGATNAGGFLAVGRYTSHMTGILSSVADNLALGEIGLGLAGLSFVLAFLAGSITTAWVVNWGLRRDMRSAYARPLVIEAALLLVFGLFGAIINKWATLFVPMTVLLLCYIMGLQNALITKVSHAVIRTTHITGLLTDLGIELGKLLYINRLSSIQKVAANRHKLRILSTLIACFFTGALAGAFGFKTYGYIATLPLALILLMLVWSPLKHDIDNGRFASGS